YLPRRTGDCSDKHASARYACTAGHTAQYRTAETSTREPGIEVARQVGACGRQRLVPAARFGRCVTTNPVPHNVERGSVGLPFCTASTFANSNGKGAVGNSVVLWGYEWLLRRGPPPSGLLLGRE